MTPEDTAACFLQYLLDREFRRAWEMLDPDMQAHQTPDTLMSTWDGVLGGYGACTQAPPHWIDGDTGDTVEASLFEIQIHGDARPISDPGLPDADADLAGVYEPHLLQPTLLAIATIDVHHPTRRVRSFMLG